MEKSMRCESMSGNTERESNKCPYCDKVPMYFEIHTKDGILGWVHDKMLSHDGQRYQAGRQGGDKERRYGVTEGAQVTLPGAAGENPAVVHPLSAEISPFYNFALD